jgi:hypothetical protein
MDSEPEAQRSGFCSFFLACILIGIAAGFLLAILSF